MSAVFNSKSTQDLSNVVKNSTCVRQENFTFIWCIEQLGDFLDRKYEISSPIFFPNTTKASKWQLILFKKHTYPEGLQVALRLHKMSTDETCHSVIYTIAVTDVHGKDQQLLTQENLFRNYFDYDECSIASSSKVKESFIQSDGTLIISCKIDLLFGENPDDNKSESLKSDENINIPVTNDFSSLSIQKPNEFEMYTNSLPRQEYSNAPDFQMSTPLEKVCNNKMSDVNVNYHEDIDKIDYNQYSEENFKHHKGSNISSDKYDKKTRDLSEKIDSFLFMAKERAKKANDKGSSKNFEILSEDLYNLYTSKDQCDITILTDDGRIQAHKAILTARSEYFRRTVNQSENEIYLQRINAVTLDSILYYMYTGQSPKMTFDHAVDILSACQILQLDYLRDIAETSLKSQINISNVTDVICISQNKKLDNLKIYALMFVAKNHEAVTKTPKWDQLMRNDPHAAGEILLTIASYQKTNNLKKKEICLK